MLTEDQLTIQALERQLETLTHERDNLLTVIADATEKLGFTSSRPNDLTSAVDRMVDAVTETIVALGHEGCSAVDLTDAVSGVVRLLAGEDIDDGLDRPEGSIASKVEALVWLLQYAGTDTAKTEKYYARLEAALETSNAWYESCDPLGEAENELQHLLNEWTNIRGVRLQVDVFRGGARLFDIVMTHADGTVLRSGMHRVAPEESTDEVVARHVGKLRVEGWDVGDEVGDWKERFGVETPAESTSSEDTCNHGVTFDAAKARDMSAHEVREAYPRLFGPCPKGCGYDGIYYASWEHFVAGDW